MASGIEIPISADVQQAVVPIKQLQTELGKLKTSLKNASDPTEINKLNAAIVDQKNKIQQSLAATNAFATSTFGVSRATRLAHADIEQTARSFELLASGSERGVDALANLAFTFERLHGATGSAAGAFEAIAETLTSPAGILVGLSLLVSLFGKTEDKTKELDSDVKQLGESFKLTVDQVKEFRTILSNVDWNSAIINVKTFGNTGVGALEILQLKLSRFTDIIAHTKVGIDVLGEEFDKLSTDPKRVSGTEKERSEIEEALKKNLKAQQDIHKELLDEQGQQQVLTEQIRLQQLNNQKDADDKSLQETQDFINRAKQLFERFPRLGRGVSPIDSLLDTLPQQLSKAKSITKEFNDTLGGGGLFKALLFGDINPEEQIQQFNRELRTALDFGQEIGSGGILQTVKKNLAGPDFKNGVVTIKVQLIPTGEKDAKQAFQDAFDKAKSFKGVLDVAVEFGAITKGAAAAAEAVDSLLTPAFQGLFEAIEKGQNPIKAFFNSIIQSLEQLLSKLIATVIEAAILSALFPGGLGGVSGFGGFFTKILGFASGGVVSGPTIAMVGERSTGSNPEVIAPLSALQGMLGGAGGNVNVTVQGFVKGNDIALIQARTSRSQSRGFGR